MLCDQILYDFIKGFLETQMIILQNIYGKM